MRKFLLLAVAAVAALGMMSHGAEAAKRAKKPVVVVTPWQSFWNSWGVRDPKLAGSNFVVGAAATGAYFAVNNRYHGPLPSGAAYVGTSIGCAAVSPIVGTLVVRRELSMREVWVSTSNCFVPVVGGWLANNYFDRHPEWDLPPGKRR
jgi:acetyl-CoA carboxylase carboxyltransferase component